MHRLITLCYSHFNEKARWALDRFQVPYVEERYVPPFSMMAVAVATRGRGGAADKASSRFSSPVLITDDGRALCDSTLIVRFAAEQAGAESQLFPNDEVAALVDHYGTALGPHTRRVAYWHVLRHPGMITEMARNNVSARQARWFERVLPAAEKMMKRSLDVTESGRDRSLKYVRRELDAAAERLKRTPYLAGNEFTAADLTFAALLSPPLCITSEEGYGAVLPSRESFDAEARAIIDEVQNHPAGRFARKIYAEERKRKANQPHPAPSVEAHRPAPTQ